jgi:hypothetical protein
MKKYLIIIIFMIVISTNLFSLELLEPISKDLTYNDTVELGFFSPGEFFMISFLLEENENYNNISISPNQINDVIVEKTRQTRESIFTEIKLADNLSGPYSLKLILSSENQKREIILNMEITNQVIHSKLINYNPYVKYEQKETITLSIINKSNTTKKIMITSDISDKWFLDKKERLSKEKKIILQPNSVTEQIYQYYPKEIGEKNFTLKIYPKEEDLTNSINYNIKIETIKDLKSIYGSKEHFYPLFNSNLIPIYFLNKIIKII